MKKTFSNLRRLHYEARMFISLTIVSNVCILYASIAPSTDPLLRKFGQLLSIPYNEVITLAYLSGAAAMMIASLLRIWAGSQLSSNRVMAFPVQDDRLILTGPYQLVRNPIYLADLIAVTGAALPLGLPGLLLPLLFRLHYTLLIRYEEYYLRVQHKREFQEFVERVPRLIPTWRSLSGFAGSLRSFRINNDGLRHNALYVLYIIGFLVAAWTHTFWHAAAIGLPALIDWARIHTKKGLSAGRSVNDLDLMEVPHV